MADLPLQDLVQRLEQERVDADRRYQHALTALDQALRSLTPERPAVDAISYDGSQLPRANERFQAIAQSLTAAAPSDTRGVAGRLRAFIWRMVGPALTAQQDLNAALIDHLNRNVAGHEAVTRAVDALVDAVAADRAASARFNTDLIVFLQTITPYVDTKDRAIGGPELREQIVLANERAMALRREIEGLRAHGSGQAPGHQPPTSRSETTPAAHLPPPTDFSYVGFEDRFRGSQEEIRARLVDYVPLFASATPAPDTTHPVLDVGCGRGELLALFAEVGVPARGIDSNGEMAALCQERGFSAERADALAFLESQPDGSLGGLTAIQVVEHLPPPYLTRLLEAAFHKLRPGAPLVLETINPGCWMAFFEAYLRDLTHAQPIHADVLRFLVQASGFTSVDVQYRSPVREADRLRKVEAPETGGPAALLDAIEAVNAHADALNARLFGFMDYAVIARR